MSEQRGRLGFGRIAGGMLLAAVLTQGVPADEVAAIPAFPGAEGYGALTMGGRGGRVLVVTCLDDAGPGSLRAACRAEGPRIVVFRVAGTIALDSPLRIDQPYITLAGQTAPGDGVCIKGSLIIDANDVILRYLRVRPDPSVGEVDAITGRYHRNILLDHLSASWSSDEVLSVYRNENVTIQWCLISEACAKFIEGENTGHRFGGIWGNHHSTYHHNLLAHNDSRNPRWAPGTGLNDYRNNVVYNWGYNSCYGGEALDASTLETGHLFTVDMVANYYKPGPATRSNVRRRLAAPSGNDFGVGRWHVQGNQVEGYPAVSADNWRGIDGDDYVRMDRPWDALPITQQSPEAAYEQVLLQVGCSLPARDAVDERVIEEVRTGTATFGRQGIITVPSDVGGWPLLRSLPAPADTDRDGMPDAWERTFGFDGRAAGDAVQDADGDGYTNVEEYLNGTDPTEYVDYTLPENNIDPLWGAVDSNTPLDRQRDPGTVGTRPRGR